MTPQQWKKVQAVFARAARIEDSAKRNSYLKEACRGQRGLRAEVESLLGEHEKSGPFLGVYSSISGKTISHYRVGKPIGGGGMGVIHKARDTRLDRVVALKVLPAGMMGDARNRDRLVHEAKCASALNHPNIVTVYELEHDKGVDFIVMEYLYGKTLNHVIPPRGLPALQALRYALQIADGLSVAHAAGILHGDLKPLNIMITGDERVKLLDFGLAKALAAGDGKLTELTQSERFGTTEYMAPELQLRGRAFHPDARSEIFTVGLILHQMLSGKHPFDLGSFDLIPEAIRTKNPRSLPTRVPASVATIVERCLQKKPEKRFQSMRSVLIALKRSTAAVDRGTVEEDMHNPPVKMASPGPRSGGQSTDMRKVRAITARIEYKNIARSREALTELARLLGGGATEAVRQNVTEALRDFILTLDEYPDGVPNFVRELRKQAFEVLRISKQGSLNQCFRDQDLEHLDLYGMNFASEQLSGLSFRGCFLVEANFQKSNLMGASFGGAYVRNADFAAAELADADFTDADWFNAPGLTAGQLERTRKDTLMTCPPDVQEIHRYLEARYGIPFKAWSGRVQEQLKATWNEYLRPGGLRDIVAGWRQKQK